MDRSFPAVAMRLAVTLKPMLLMDLLFGSFIFFTSVPLAMSQTLT
jgi:hypothetical protein